jgi:hypothetical protein
MTNRQSSNTAPSCEALTAYVRCRSTQTMTMEGDWANLRPNNVRAFLQPG